MPDDELPASLIAEIYEAGLDPSRWSALGPALAAALEGGSAQLQVRGSDPTRLLRLVQTANYDDWAREAYRVEFGKHDPWVAGGVSALSKASHGTDFIPEADLARSGFYQDFLRRVEIFHVIGMVMPLSSETILSFGVHREQAAPAFEDALLPRVEKLCQHLRQAVRLTERLALFDAQASASLAALHSLGVAVLALTADARVLFANSEGEKLLAGDGALRIRQGRVTTSDASRAAAFRQLVQQASETATEEGRSPGGVLRLPHASGAAEILISPLRPATSALEPWLRGAIVFVSVPQRVSPAAAKLLTERYDLTRAETRLLSALLAGEQPANYAASRRLSRNTIKTQVRSLLAKTGHASTASLRSACATDPLLRLL